MSTLIEKVKNNILIKTTLEIILFLMCLPIINILLKSIFALGQSLGTFTRIIGN